MEAKQRIETVSARLASSQELVILDFIEEVCEGFIGGKSDMFKLALKKLHDEYKEDKEALIRDVKQAKRQLKAA